MQPEPCNETTITTFSVGTSRPARNSEGKTFKDANGYIVKDTEWHRITCSNGLGKTVAQHAKKGMLVSVQGRLHYSQYDKDGLTRYATEVIAEDVQFLTRSKAETDREGATEVD